MSTSKILGGAQYKSARQRRKAAMDFFANQGRLKGAPGMIALAIYATLKKVHRDPTLNTREKDREFKRVITAGAHATVRSADSPVDAQSAGAPGDRLLPVPVGVGLPLPGLKP